jgi:hypothetical protein
LSFQVANPANPANLANLEISKLRIFNASMNRALIQKQRRFRFFARCSAGPFQIMTIGADVCLFGMAEAVPFQNAMIGEGRLPVRWAAFRL